MIGDYKQKPTALDIDLKVLETEKYSAWQPRGKEPNEHRFMNQNMSWMDSQKPPQGTSLVIQWLRLCTSTKGGTGLFHNQGTKMPHALWCDQKKKSKNYAHRMYILSCLLTLNLTLNLHIYILTMLSKFSLKSCFFFKIVYIHLSQGSNHLLPGLILVYLWLFYYTCFFEKEYKW